MVFRRQSCSHHHHQVQTGFQTSQVTLYSESLSIHPCLALNATKTRKMTFDPVKNQNVKDPVLINTTPVKVLNMYKYLYQHPKRSKIVLIDYVEMQVKCPMSTV